MGDWLPKWLAETFLRELEVFSEKPASENRVLSYDDSTKRRLSTKSGFRSSTLR